MATLDREPDVAALVREERLLDAAALAGSRGLHQLASDLYERACAWSLAAEHAEQAKDIPRAILMSAQAKDEARGQRLLPALGADKATLSRLGYQLANRGEYAWAAKAYEGAGERREAARAWEQSGNVVRAASLLEGLGEAPLAAKALEAALRRSPDASDVSLALGSLLVRFGKLEAGVRALQRIAPAAYERREALSVLSLAFDKLGLREAKRECEEELEHLGGAPPRSVSDAPPASVHPPASVRKQRLFGRYEVQSEVASSANARVLECTDIVQHSHVALKIFVGQSAIGTGRDALARFEREVRILASMNHPNIVPLREYIPEGPAIATAWMEGGTLETLLARESLSPRRSVEIARSVLLAAAEAHRLSVLHRDIKPGNVLFDAAGTAKLADFGVAHLNDVSATATAGVIGTLAYMSPEQRRGAPASPQSDVYGTGALLLEMLTGSRPPLEGEPRLLPSAVHRDLSKAHDDVILSLLKEDPGERPESALAARARLQELAWPDVIERIALRPPTVPPPAALGGDSRFVPHTEGRHFDTTLERVVRSVPLREGLVERLGAFARVDHPCAQIVSRVDPEHGIAWLVEPPGTPLTRPLEPNEKRDLFELVEQLHRVGFVHGHIDGAHVVVASEANAVMLLFPTADAPLGASLDQDRLAIARL